MFDWVGVMRFLSASLVALIALLSVAGCQSLNWPSEPTAASPIVEPAPPQLDLALADELHDLLRQSAWQIDLKWSVVALGEREPSRAWRYVFLPKPPGEQNATPIVREDTYWRGLWDGTIHGFDEHERDAITSLLHRWRDEGGIVGLNATILIARWDVSRACVPADAVMQTLRGIAEGGFPTPDLPVPLATRCAAAEAWCHGLLQAFDDGDREALDPAGRLLQRPGLPDELRATMWRKLAMRVAPDCLPGLSRTLADRRQQSLRRAAMEACVIAASWGCRGPSASRSYPETLPSLRLDPDPMLRQLFARWAAVSYQDDAVQWLRELCRDVDPLVHDQAIHCLGKIHREAARDTLRELCRQDSDHRRSVAVAALANWGVDEIQPFASDASPGVRAAAISSLAKFPCEASQQLLRAALDDAVLDVQAAAVSAVADWPIEQAVPVWLEAIRIGALRTRQQAQTALQLAVGPSASFPLDEPLAEREQALRSWAAWNGWPADLVQRAPAAATRHEDSAVHSARIRALLESFLATPSIDAWDQLCLAVQPADVPLVERGLLGRSDSPAERIIRELLPTLSPVHGAVEQLAERDVQRRRQAARQLADASSHQALSPFLLRRLHDRLTLEQDQQVWQWCMAAIDRESHAEAAQIALVALHSTWPDVRRLGVEYIAHHPTAEAALWLLPLFGDPQRSVRLAAISTAGQCGNRLVLNGLPASGEVSAQPGLRALMTHTDADVRWVVLLAMARLRDDVACQELVRLTFDPHPATREHAVRTMGQSGQRQFVEPLLKLLWTEPFDHVKQTILASLEELVPVENRSAVPAGLAASSSIDDKIRYWAAWWTAARAGTEASFADGSHDEAARQTQRW